MIEGSTTFWERLLFRDYLIAHREVARAYKTRLAAAHPNDRIAYTNGKSDFIAKIMAVIRQTSAV